MESSGGMGENARAKAREGCRGGPCHRVVHARRQDVGRGARHHKKGGVGKATEIDWWGGEVEFDRVMERGSRPSGATQLVWKMTWNRRG